MKKGFSAGFIVGEKEGSAALKEETKERERENFNRKERERIWKKREREHLIKFVGREGTRLVDLNPR